MVRVVFLAGVLSVVLGDSPGRHSCRLLFTRPMLLNDGTDVP